MTGNPPVVRMTSKEARGEAMYIDGVGVAPQRMEVAGEATWDLVLSSVERRESV